MNDSKTKQKQVVFKGKIRNKIFLSFLLIFLIPFILVSLYAYTNQSKNFRARTMNDLLATTALKQQFIKNFVHEIVVDLETKAENFSNISLMKELVTSYRRSRLSASDFVESFEWANINIEDGADLRTFQLAHNYHNIYLIDTEGNILFSTEEGSNLGTNVLKKDYPDPELSNVYRRAIEKKGVVISDCGNVDPSDNHPAIYFAQIIEDDETGDNIGQMVLHIPYGKIEDVLEQRVGLGESGESYLVGDDLFMRSNSRFYSETTIRKQRVETENTRQWMKAHEGDKLAESSSEQFIFNKVPTCYTDYRDVMVYGVFVDLKFLHKFGLDWVLISEIDEQEAYLLLHKFRNITLLLGAIILLVVVIAAFLSARKISLPISMLLKGTREVARGDMSQDIIITSNDEIGLLAQNFNKMKMKVKESHDDLEQKIKDKTSELEASRNGLEMKVQARTVELQNARKGLEKEVEKRTRELRIKYNELERMNKAFVGRELKMVDLKKEIEKLKSNVMSDK